MQIKITSPQLINLIKINKKYNKINLQLSSQSQKELKLINKITTIFTINT